ncbi:MAG: Holliday junction branch migration protein RuvA [Candidatus Aminicenantes bacterium]|nr:Holliday junction branch migration protein RuvA [Candidatus Aminicenantes bacterium]
MIAAVRGKIIASAPGYISVDSGTGIILHVLVPVSAYAQLRADQDVMLHTVLKIKDEDVFIYGFPQLQEKALFEKLIAVSGIGPKIAMSCISALAFDEWIAAIAAADVTRISSIPGIGKKTAQRLILELTGKLGFSHDIPDAHAQLRSDLISGLANLGYPLKGARETVNRVLKENSSTAGFEALFKTIMKKMKP